MFVCKFCESSRIAIPDFGKEVELDAHISAAHLNWTPYECAYCDFVGACQYNIECHAAKFHSKRKVKWIFTQDEKKSNLLALLKENGNFPAQIDGVRNSTSDKERLKIASSNSEVSDQSFHIDSPDSVAEVPIKRELVESVSNDASPSFSLEVLNQQPLRHSSPQSHILHSTSKPRAQIGTQRTSQCAQCEEYVVTSESTIEGHVWYHLGINLNRCPSQGCNYWALKRQMMPYHLMDCHAEELKSSAENLDYKQKYKTEFELMHRDCFPNSAGSEVRNQRPSTSEILANSQIDHSASFSSSTTKNSRETPAADQPLRVQMDLAGNLVSSKKSVMDSQNSPNMQLSFGPPQKIPRFSLSSEFGSNVNTSEPVSYNFNRCDSIHDTGDLGKEYGLHERELAIQQQNAAESPETGIVWTSEESEEQNKDACKVCGAVVEVCQRGPHVYYYHLRKPRFLCPHNNCPYFSVFNAFAIKRHCQLMHKGEPNKLDPIDQRHLYEEEYKVWRQRCYGVTRRGYRESIAHTPP